MKCDMHIESISDELLDELATGTLTGERYRNLLAALESQPARWRDCALVFLREQALSKELKSLARGNVDWNGADWDVEQLHALASPSEAVQWVSHGTPKHNLARFTKWLCSLAALLLLSFAAGWLAAGQLGSTANLTAMSDATGQRPASDSSFSQSLQPKELVPSSPALSPRNAARQQPDVDTHSVRFVSEQFVPIDCQVPAELLDLERRGQVRIETFDAVMPISFEDGTAAMVPIQQFRVLPNIFTF